LKKVEEKIGYIFKRPAYLKEALTHSSYANEHKIPSNERLEFLGDSVLSIIMSDKLFRDLPDVDEGTLTKIRASIVCEETLAELAAGIGLGKMLYLGNGENQSGGRMRPSITSDAFEALLGAIYLDSGMDAARRWLLNIADNAIKKAIKSRDLRDYKTHLQEYVQREKLGFVRYMMVDKNGPVHEIHFIMQAYIRDRAMGIGEGSSKKEAEQQAAKATLEMLKNETL